MKTDDLVITINGKIIDHSQRGIKDGLTFWMEPDGIQFLGKFMKVGMNIQIESDSEMTAWKIELKNAKGGIVISLNNQFCIFIILQQQRYNYSCNCRGKKNSPCKDGILVILESMFQIMYGNG